MSGYRAPKLADVQCTRLKFEPGDKLLVKVKQKLSKEQTVKLLKSVRAWAGDGVEVLLIDTTVVELEVQRADKKLHIVGGS